VARGIIVNGLTILSDFRNLDAYFDRHVMGGTGSFVISSICARTANILVDRSGFEPNQ
jgi:hypothetical protein